MRLYLLTVDDPLYTHLTLDPLLSSGTVTVGGVSILQPRLTYHRLLSALVTLGPRRCAAVALSQWAPGLLRNSVSNVFARHHVPADRILRVRDVNEAGHVQRVRQSGCDVMLVLNSPQILKAPLLSAVPAGVINLHFGMLPRYRGIMPAYHALMNGDDRFGVSAYYMDAEIDNGPIIEQRVVPIAADDTLPDLYRKGFEVAGSLLVDLACRGGPASALVNDATRASYYGYPSLSSLLRYWRLAIRRNVGRRVMRFSQSWRAST